MSQVVFDIVSGAEPIFIDGIIAMAVNCISDDFGVSYFSLSGNLGAQYYQVQCNPIQSHDNPDTT
eukprot:9427829-Ditylum_brightwellii.AAC.1